MLDELLERQHQPLLIVISGPSGVGKDSVVRRMKERSLPFFFVVTVTTRPKRSEEVEGVDYFFVSQAEFDRMIERGDLIEHALVYNDYKGIPKVQVREGLSSGMDVVMRIDVQGAETVRALAPQALLIFLSTRDEEELIRRLKRRKTETEEDLELRLNTVREELQHVDIFDYYVINAEDQLDATVDTILDIIHAEHQRTKPRQVHI
jgi:guanylate kinase